MISIGSWYDVEYELRHHSSGALLKLPKGWLPHPRVAGMRPSVGLPVGQSADYRLTLNDGAGLHVQDHGDHYLAHIDEVDPDSSLFEHLRRDTPGMFVGGCSALGAVVGAAAGRSKASTAVGAAVGGLVALAFVVGGKQATEKDR